MWINQGYPYNLQSRGTYIDAVTVLGFVKAHKNFLQDIKTLYKKDPFLKEYPREAAEQAFHLHVYFIYLAMHTGAEIPSIRDLDAMFVEVFGRPGKDIIDSIYSGMERNRWQNRTVAPLNLEPKKIG